MALSNLGFVATDKIKKDRRFIFVPFYGSSGTRNKLTKSALNEAYVIAQINAADPLDRWYVLPVHENPEITREANAIEKLNFDTTFLVKKGIITFKALIPLAAKQLIKKIDEFRSENIGIFFIDNDENFIGMADDVDKTILYPIPINSKSLSAVADYGSATTVSKCMLEFQAALAYDEGMLFPILRADLDFNGLDEVTFNGLIDIDQTLDATATVMTVTLNLTGYEQPALGFVTADFTLYNVTALASLAQVTTTTSAGVYTLTYASQTASHVIRCTVDKEKYSIIAGTAIV